jgi:hypothetical protein
MDSLSGTASPDSESIRRCPEGIRSREPLPGMPPPDCPADQARRDKPAKHSPALPRKNLSSPVSSAVYYVAATSGVPRAGRQRSASSEFPICIFMICGTPAIR